GEPRDRALVGGAACARRGAPRRIARGDARARSARQSLAWRGSRGPAAQGAPRRRARARRAAGRRVRRGAPSVRALAARSGAEGAARGAAQGPADRRLLPRPVLPDVGRGGEAAVEAWLPCVQACRRGCGMARRGDAPRIAAARRTFRSGGPDRFVSDATIRLGLRENLAQFSLLLVVNAFVGAMVGLERSILPAIAERDFQLAARAAILSFIVVFGLAKALTNYGAGRLADRFGRKRVLVSGWLVAAPVPFLLMWGPSWNWVVAANVLLGVSQGLTWSLTVIMKIDLVGAKRRGLAMGLNEFSGYIAVAASAFATGWIAAHYGLRPQPFYLGVAYVALGLLLSALFVRETLGHVSHESKLQAPEPGKESLTQRQIFVRASLTDRNLSSVSQAGLVNNLNDGMAWGIFPLY